MRSVPRRIYQHHQSDGKPSKYIEGVESLFYFVSLQAYDFTTESPPEEGLAG